MTHALFPSTAQNQDARDAEIARLRTLLEECRRERQEQLDALGPVAPGEDPVVAAQRASVRGVLEEIEAAFRRMDEGTYGVCLHCDAALPVERLEFVPYAAGCVNCLQARKAG